VAVLLLLRESDIVRQQLQKCLVCGAHCLTTTCPKCGGTAQVAAPMKWSPEDKRAHLRRKLDGVEQEGWAQSLPTLSNSEEE
jgi:rRNA maturation protein Nop10